MLFDITVNLDATKGGAQIPKTMRCRPPVPGSGLAMLGTDEGVPDATEDGVLGVAVPEPDGRTDGETTGAAQLASTIASASSATARDTVG
jgi:hypothetical protein